MIECGFCIITKIIDYLVIVIDQHNKIKQNLYF